MPPTFTQRQQEVYDRLMQDPPMEARAIAKELNISRNAVYQQITALKRKGALDPTFTPSGEVRASAGSERAEQIVGFVAGNGHGTTATLDVVRELVQQNSRLIAQNERLIDIIAGVRGTASALASE